MYAYEKYHKKTHNCFSCNFSPSRRTHRYTSNNSVGKHKSWKVKSGSKFGDFIKQIKASKENIRQNIKDKLENKKPDVQEISKRIYGKDGIAIDDYILQLDIKFIVNTEGLNRIEIPGIKKFLVKGLESAITEVEAKHLEELGTYYKVFENYFNINHEIIKARAFEDYVFNNDEAIKAKIEHNNRFKHLIDEPFTQLK
ncbi:hypothetical protein ACVRW4_06160 [Streptococcus phocae subsp. phocae]